MCESDSWVLLKGFRVFLKPSQSYYPLMAVHALSEIIITDDDVIFVYGSTHYVLSTFQADKKEQPLP